MSSNSSIAASKADEVFYRLTPSEARKLRTAKLTAAEWRIWSYLIELDPWGDRYQDLDTLTVMQECGASKATFYRAIAKLQDLKLFDFQDKGFSFKNTTAVSKMRQQSQKCDSSLKNETTFSKMRQLSQKCENRELEPAQSNGSGVSQTIQTYSDLIRSLSDSERENFLEFGRNKAKQLPRPPELPDKWVTANWEELRSQWEASGVGKKAKDEAVAAADDWSSDPRFDEWLNKAYSVGKIWIKEEPTEVEERTRFYRWFEQTKADVVYFERLINAS